ncbi:hypothetical protein BHM03_00014205 [Ensete ventricosum]|nr:hypothetical protein BHM03_00014205 [Ensete ventricosum]
MGILSGTPRREEEIKAYYNRTGEEQRPTPGFSSPSSSFSLLRLIPPKIANSRNRPLPPDSGRQRSKSIVTGRFQVVTRWKQPQSAIQPGSGLSAYRSAGKPVHTAHYNGIDQYCIP